MCTRAILAIPGSYRECNLSKTIDEHRFVLPIHEMIERINSGDDGGTDLQELFDDTKLIDRGFLM